MYTSRNILKIPIPKVQETPSTSSSSLQSDVVGLVYSLLRHDHRHETDVASEMRREPAAAVVYG